MPALSQTALHSLMRGARRHFPDVLHVEHLNQIWISNSAGICICSFELTHLDDDLIVYRWHEKVEDVEIMRILRTVVGPLVLAGNKRVLTDLAALKRSLKGLNPLISRDVIPQAERHGLRQVALVVDAALRNHLPNRYFTHQQFGTVRVRYFTDPHAAMTWVDRNPSAGEVIPPMLPTGANLTSPI